MKRFEIMEKFYLSKALLKMAGGGVHPPHMDPPLLVYVPIQYHSYNAMQLLYLFTFIG